MKLRLIPFLMVAWLCGLSAQQTRANVTVNIKGTVVIPPCTINNGDIIEFNFGDAIPVQDIVSGVMVTRNKSFRVTCTDNPSLPNGVNLLLTGPVVPGKSDLVGTSKPQLAIKMLVTSSRGAEFLNNNSVLTDIPANVDTILIASLVTGEAGELTEGSFTGSATLTASIP
ncbi:fimbrial protein [Rahnella victoriana]|uniref:fimbrial protein n=1 Tax=Rahnella victoriana TaxID=1510570 RepID=UPI000BB1D44D|nr:fimbrial protein [Rahnella victoriana]